MEGYVRTVDDVMAIKPRFRASMGYHIFLTMVLHARGALLFLPKSITVTSSSSEFRMRLEITIYININLITAHFI